VITATGDPEGETIVDEPREIDVESVKSKFTRAVKLAEELPYDVRRAADRAVDVGKRHLTPGYIDALERYAASAAPPADEALRRRLAALKPLAGKVIIGGIIAVAGRRYHLFVDFDTAELLHADSIELP
jgi:hypothetical protein